MRLFFRSAMFALVALLLCPIALSAASPWERHRQDRGYISDPREQTRQKSQTAANAAQKELAALYDELESMRHSKAFQRMGLTFWHRQSARWLERVRALSARLGADRHVDSDLKSAAGDLLALAYEWKRKPDGTGYAARRLEENFLWAIGRETPEPAAKPDEVWDDENDDEEDDPCR